MKRQVLLSVLAAIAIFAVTTTAQAGMFGRLSVIRGCAPCEPACCDPCEPACAPCEPQCDPCEPSCDDAGCNPCGYRPFRPFGGFFLRMRAKMANGCGPCGEVGCDPCEPACCDPCEPACDPCEPACDPCESACDPCGGCDTGCGPCGKRFLPFNGFFLNLRNKMAYKMAGCGPCGEVSCDPCEPACCDPCEPACCDSCK